MPRKKPALAPGAQPRGRGRPSKAELALRAEVQAHAATVPGADIPPTEPEGPQVPADALGATLDLQTPSEPIEPPVMPPAPPSPPPARAPRAEVQDLSVMSAADREDPRKLLGENLRAFAHQRGVSRSEMAGRTDEWVREQVKLIVYRQYEHA